MSPIFQRFTEQGRQVVVLAQDESRALGHGYIGTEHLLLGLLREEEGIAAKVLASFGVYIDAVRELVGRGDAVATGMMPFTPPAKKSLELALHESLELGHTYVGTEHLLLALTREDESVGARVLLDLGLDGERVRAATIDLLSG